MSTRPQIKPNLVKPLINAASMATSITGPVSIISNLPGMGYDVSWTGTPTGTFQVQVSNSAKFDGEGNYIAGTGNWTILPSSSFTGTYPVPSGSAGNGYLDVLGTNAYAIQLIYTATSGSGALTVYPTSKVW
jgi:hypothetical protein